jgi:3-isopropylmalate/(R)-2-methylmalate dehydratase small subunit
MQPFTKVTGVAAPLLMDDVNTDQISPAERGHGLKPDLKAMLFSRAKKTEPDFVLNRPQFKDTRILVSRENFGCGSSRENAVWALMANDITCVIARSIADIFKENCLRNGVLPISLGEAGAAFEAKVVAADGAKPFTVDLTTQTISCPDGTTMKFDISSAERTALLEGLDDIGMTLKHKADIEAFEAKLKQSKPWLQTAARQQ